MNWGDVFTRKNDPNQQVTPKLVTVPVVVTSAGPSGSSAGSIPLSRFEKAIRYVMENEDGVRWDHDDGEFTNNPKDPGGATMWGIIKTEYEGFLGKSLTVDEVKAMPREAAEAIYRKNFWMPIHGDSFKSAATATAIMDTAVNKGLGGCMVILTDALHNHFTDRYGLPMELAVDAMNDQDFLAAMDSATIRYINRRIEDYPNMEWARRGWANRANRLPAIPAYLGGL